MPSWGRRQGGRGSAPRPGPARVGAVGLGPAPSYRKVSTRPSLPSHSGSTQPGPSGVVTRGSPPAGRSQAQASESSESDARRRGPGARRRAPPGFPHHGPRSSQASVAAAARAGGAARLLYSCRRPGPPAGRGQAPELVPGDSAGSRAADLRPGFRVGVRVTRNGAGHRSLRRSQASESLAAARAAVGLEIHPPRPAFAACKGHSHGRGNLISHVERIGQVNGSDGRLGGTVAGGGERLQGEGSCGPDRGQAASRPSQSQGRRGWRRPARGTRPDGAMVEGRSPV